MSEKDAARLLYDVCQALDYVHSRGVWSVASVVATVPSIFHVFFLPFPSHRDLKPENILLSDRSVNANVKIAVRKPFTTQFAITPYTIDSLFGSILLLSGLWAKSETTTGRADDREISKWDCVSMTEELLFHYVAIAITYLFL